MKRLLLSFVALIAWMAVFYNIERLNGTVRVTPIAYLFAPTAAVLIIIARRLREAPVWGVYAACTAAFLALRAGFGYPMWGDALPLTVAEGCAIALTVALAREVGKRIQEFEEAVAHITIGRPARRPARGVEPSVSGQVEMYRELRRARHHQRPLSIIAVGIEDGTAWAMIDRLVRETQSKMIQQYLLSRVAGILDSELEDYNIIARNHNKFIVLLPEVTAQQLPDLAAQLKQVVAERAGVDVQIGLASFPEDGATFDALLREAVERMSIVEPDHSMQVVEEKYLWS